MPTQNIHRDKNINDPTARLFGIICELDRGPRGCFARRETLARMQGCSVSTINHQLAALKKAGYITITTLKRRVDEPAIIRVVPNARSSSGFSAPLMANDCLQANCKQSYLYDEVNYMFKKKKTTTNKHRARSIPIPDLDQSDVVVKALIDIGISPSKAIRVAKKYPAARIEAVLTYVRNYRSAIKNLPGLVYSLITSTETNLPAWVYNSAPKPSNEDDTPTKKNHSPIVPETQAVETPDPQREACKSNSENREIWDRVSIKIKNRIQPQSFATWIDPLFIENIENDQIILNAPDSYTADWVREHYMSILQIAFDEILGQRVQYLGICIWDSKAASERNHPSS